MAVPKILIVLKGKDESNPAEKLKKELPEFSIYCVQMNSCNRRNQQVANTKLINDIWLPFMKVSKEESKEEHGMYISLGERNSLKLTMIDVVGKVLIPEADKLQKKLTEKNAPKGFFKFFSKEANASCFKRGETAWELRFAGDLGLVLQDYPSAVVNYKRLLDRIQKSAAPDEVASCREFLAIAALVVEGNKREFKHGMENAMLLYEKAKNFNLVARNAIYAGELLTLLKCSEEAVEYLARAAQCVGHEAELSCLLYEHAALCSARSLLVRKFALHMGHAGTHYLRTKCIDNSIYCLELCYKLYERANWPEILLNTCTHLAKALEEAKNYSRSFDFHKKLLQISVAWAISEPQEVFFKALVESAKQLRASVVAGSEFAGEERAQRAKECAQMHDLFEIHLNSVEIFTPQDQLYCNDINKLFFGTYDMAQIVYRKTRFELTEEDLAQSVEGVANMPQSWTTLGKMLDEDLNDPIENSDDPKMVRREEKLRDLYFNDERHPKKKVLLYSEKKRFVYVNEPLIIKFECRNPFNVNIPVNNMQVLCHYLNPDANSGDALEYQSTLMTLKKNDEREILLRVVPKIEGELCIEGVQWEVAELITGVFKLSKVTESASPIVVRVLGKAGALEMGALKNLKTRYANDEVDSYTLRLRNAGQLPITQISLQTDFPLFLGWKALKLDWVLQPNEEREINFRLWAVAAEGVKRKVPVVSRVLIRYLGSAENSEVPYYRYRRIEHCFSISENFAIRTRQTNYFKENEYLFNVQARQLSKQHKSFCLNKLSVIGDKWKITEKQQFENYNRTYSNYITLISASQPSVPLKDRQITLNKDVEDHNNDVVESESGFINEYKDHLNNEYFNIAKVSTIDLLATWTLSFSKRVCKGMSIVPITINPEIAKEQEHGFPLKVLHDCPKEVAHDFGECCICSVPLKLVLRNYSDVTVSFRLEAAERHRDARSGFMWQGQTVQNIVGLERDKECEVHLEACVTKPGVYDLNRFSFALCKDPATGVYLDPSEADPKSASVKTHSLEFDQILVTVANKAADMI